MSAPPAAPVTAYVAAADEAVSTSLVILNGFLVFFMQVGFLALETGSGRAKNVRNILLKNLLDVMLAALVWWAVGWAFAYGTSARGVIGYSGFFYDGSMTGLAASRPWYFSWTFCIAACTIISGCLAERTALAAYPAATLLIAALVHPLLVHWIWSPQGWLGSVSECSVLDFAGGMVVHMLGGVFGLVGAWMCGPRLGRFEVLSCEEDEEEQALELEGQLAAGLAAGGHAERQLQLRQDGAAPDLQQPALPEERPHGDAGSGDGSGTQQRSDDSADARAVLTLGAGGSDGATGSSSAAAAAQLLQRQHQQQDAAASSGGGHGLHALLPPPLQQPGSVGALELAASGGFKPAAAAAGGGLAGDGRAGERGPSPAGCSAALHARSSVARTAAAAPSPDAPRVARGAAARAAGSGSGSNSAGAGRRHALSRFVLRPWRQASAAGSSAGRAAAGRDVRRQQQQQRRRKPRGGSELTARGGTACASGICRYVPKPMPGHDMAFVTLGTFMLWFGWMGFNNGSVYLYVAGNTAAPKPGALAGVLSADVVQRTSMNTALGGATAGLTSLLAAALFWGTYDLRICCNGVLSGLVTVTCMCGFVDPWAAVVCSGIAGGVYTGLSWLLLRCGIDDPLDSSAVHLGNGLLGTLLLAFVANPAHVYALTGSPCGGIFYTSRGWLQLGMQLLAVVVVLAFGGGSAAALFWGLRRHGLLRVDQVTELAGIDNMEHGGPAYPEVSATWSSSGGGGQSMASGRRLLL